jgi:hypothetical protein
LKKKRKALNLERRLEIIIKTREKGVDLRKKKGPTIIV